MRKNFNRFVDKLSYLKEVLCMPGLLSRICNKSNFSKFLIIFIVGFVSRLLVSYFYTINVSLDFLTPVSILYYICMSAFIILVHEFINYFNFNPSFTFVNGIFKAITDILGFIIRMFISMNKRIFLYKLEDFKVSSIIKGAKYFFNSDRAKATMHVNQPLAAASQENVNRTKILDSESLKEKSYILEKNDKNGSNKSSRGIGGLRGVNSERVRAREEEIRLRREAVNRL